MTSPSPTRPRIALPTVTRVPSPLAFGLLRAHGDRWALFGDTLLYHYDPDDEACASRLNDVLATCPFPVSGTQPVSAASWKNVEAVAAREARRQRRGPSEGTTDREAGRVQARAALYAAPETLVTATDVAFAIGLRDAEVRAARPASARRVGRTWRAPFRDWLVILDLEVLNAQEEEGGASEDHRAARHASAPGEGDAQEDVGRHQGVRPPGRSVVLAGAPDGHLGNGLEGVGDARGGHARPRPPRDPRPPRLAPIVRRHRDAG
ncbi:MAG: hypothetical protein JXB39_03905 [Deltaproteobacteria bacterium]|nr:hypothetical protein [Deltaproteobacteria bacterium]